jgi:hypothetical protein
VDQGWLPGREVWRRIIALPKSGTDFEPAEERLKWNSPPPSSWTA